MVGPTGCGKGYLAELLFGTILQVPVVTVDITSFVETGYMGRQVGEILYDLLTTAEGNPYWRYCQMLWMRFFLAQPRSRFAGCFDLFISPASKARFGEALTPGLPAYLASAGG